MDASNTSVFLQKQSYTDFHEYVSECNPVSSSCPPPQKKTYHVHSQFSFKKDPSWYISNLKEMEILSN